MVYAHGGGAVGGSAMGYKGYLSHMAMTCGVVVFNVDYRLAPDTKYIGTKANFDLNSFMLGVLIICWITTNL